MLEKFSVKNWTTLSTTRDPAARELFVAFLDGKIPSADIALLKDGRTGKVFKIAFRGKFYVLKHDARRRHRFEYLVSSFFYGSNAFRLLRRLDATRERGFDAPVEIFLVADRRGAFGRCVLESYYLEEFLENVRALKDVPDGIETHAASVAKIVTELHANGLVHGDVNAENFVLANARGKAVGGGYGDEIRVIDLTGKSPTPLHRASDRYWLEKIFGVKNPAPNFADFFFAATERFKAFSRKIRGK